MSGSTDNKNHSTSIIKRNPKIQLKASENKNLILFQKNSQISHNTTKPRLGTPRTGDWKLTVPAGDFHKNCLVLQMDKDCSVLPEKTFKVGFIGSIIQYFGLCL